MESSDRLKQALSRVAAVERTFGDPWNADNPVGHASILRADEAEVFLAAGLRRWQRLGMSAELVPQRYGGKFDGLDLLGVVIRSIFRRDPALAFAYGFTPLLGGQMVLLNGTDEQRRSYAEVLMHSGTVGVACQRLQHETEFHRDEYRVSRDGDGFRLRGTKTAINNANSAELIIGFVATDREGEYSLLMFDPAAAPPHAVRSRPRHRTTGVRSLQVAGLEFIDCPLPSDALVGSWGAGIMEGMRAFPAIHAGFSSMVIGLADTALRCATSGSTDRHARSVISGAFADLLLADALALAATRTVHLVPEQCDVITAVAKYMVPTLLGNSMYDLSAVLGDEFHAATGPRAVFGKHLRDLETVAFGHVSKTVCQSMIVPYLQMFAADPGDRLDAPDELFQIQAPVPPLDPARLAGFGGRDGLTSLLLAAPAMLPHDALADPLGGTLLKLADALMTEAEQIRKGAVELCAAGDDLASDARVFPLADRYAHVLAAASCLGVWLLSPELSPFHRDPSWMAIALHRLLRRLGQRPAPLPKSAVERVYTEVMARVDGHRSLDLFEVDLG